MKRRQFLKRSALTGFAGFLGYSTWKGFRYPPIMFVLDAPETRITSQDSQFDFKDVIPLSESSIDGFAIKDNPKTTFFRAIAPEPEFELTSESGSVVDVLVNNLHKETLPSVEGGELVDYTVVKTNHLIKVKVGETGKAKIKWTFLRPESYRIATIGDTGGDKELGWCITKSAQYNADFLLHLGDFVYQEGDYQRAIHYFQNSDIPVYVTIGNHDFHSSGKIFQPFLDSIGRFNHMFELGSLRAINIDSANAFFPPWAGERAKLLKEIELMPKEGVSGKVKNTVVYTHKPLSGRRHVGGVYADEWLNKRLHTLGVTHAFGGHLHEKVELDVGDIKQYVAGQGLGSQDLLLKKNVAEILLFDVSEKGLSKADWRPLDMPFEMHCNTYQKPVFEELDRMSVYLELQKKCGR